MIVLSAQDAGARGAVISLQLAGLTADAVRAAILTSVAYALPVPVAIATLGVWSLSHPFARWFVVGLAATVAGA